MRVSRYFLATLRDNPADAQIVSHRLMLRAGLIRPMSSGLYSWLPIGLKVLKNIEKIVREEQDNCGANELLMPTIQSADLWRESGRYDAFGPEMLRMKDRHDRDMLYGPTNEEVITDIFRNNFKTYKKLPQIHYHIQWKFRDEIRPRFGVMRAREFLMKDCYSFDINYEAAQETYQKMMMVYVRTFSRMGLTAIPMQADSGAIGGDLSHEFLVLAPTGESGVFFDKEFYNVGEDSHNIDVNDKEAVAKAFKNITSIYAKTDEKHDEKEFLEAVPAERRVEGRGIEVGHIFYLGTKYSDAMNANIQHPDGSELPVHMGCYGIGVSRLVACLIEASHDDNGIIWNPAVAPFHIGLINLRQGDAGTDSACERLYGEINNAGLTVLYHDTDDRAGAKFADMDLIGLPYQLVVGPNGLKNNIAEVKNRKTGEKQEIPMDKVVDFLKNELKTYL